MSSSSPEIRPAQAGVLARWRAPAVLEFAVEASPEAVLERFLARPDVVERSLDVGHGDDPAHVLQRTPGGFTLTADPGVWLTIPLAVCEVEFTEAGAGTRVLVRFHLHPLRRLVLGYVAALGLATVAVQLVLARPAIAVALLAPILVVIGLLIADRRGLQSQERALRTVVEATLTPIALPHELPPDAPFRRDRAG